MKVPLLLRVYKPPPRMLLLLMMIALMHVVLKLARESLQSADEVAVKSEQSGDEVNVLVAPKSEQSVDEVVLKSEQSSKSEQIPKPSEQSADEVVPKSEQSPKSVHSADEVSPKSEQSLKSEQSADKVSPNSEQSADEVDDLTLELHKRGFEAKKNDDVMTAMKNCSDLEANDVRSTCVDTSCARQFPTSRMARVRQLLEEPRFRLSQQQVDGIKQLSGKVPKKRFIFVTAASSFDFRRSKALVYSLRQTVFKKLSPESYSFYFYDLGLKAKERRRVEKTCNCTVKTFNASLLPVKVRNLFCYTWKPLIVQALLPYAEVLVYMDTSIRFRPDMDLDLVFDTARYRGAQLLLSPDTIPNHTVEDMFEFYGDLSCQYWPYGEILAAFLVLHNQPFVQRLIVEPWAACAFHPGCMCPSETTYSRLCPHDKRKVGQCHRFDQSSLSVGLVKLLGPEVGYLALKTHLQPEILSHLL